jgi:hypothetical protein
MPWSPPRSSFGLNLDICFAAWQCLFYAMQELCHGMSAGNRLHTDTLDWLMLFIDDKGERIRWRFWENIQ